MASIKTNGVKQQSGAGFHARKGEPGRKRTRSAVLDSAVAEQVGVAVRQGTDVNTLSAKEEEDPFDKSSDWDDE